MELAQQQGLLQYNEKRAHTASAVPAWKSPTVQSKVTVPPWATSYHSTGGAQAMALDYAAGSDEESPVPKARSQSEIRVELTELGIASCWCQLAMEVPLQKQDGPFTNVVAFLDGLECQVLSRKAWDESVFPAPLAEPNIPWRSTHLSYILGCMVDLGGCSAEPSGELGGVAHRITVRGKCPRL